MSILASTLHCVRPSFRLTFVTPTVSLYESSFHSDRTLQLVLMLNITPGLSASVWLIFKRAHLHACHSRDAPLGPPDGFSTVSNATSQACWHLRLACISGPSVCITAQKAMSVQASTAYFRVGLSIWPGISQLCAVNAGLAIINSVQPDQQRGTAY